MEQLTKRGYMNFIPVDSGGQANVYKSFKGERTFAIKVSKIDPAKQDRGYDLGKDQRLEMVIIQNLRHPNCIRVEEMFRTKDRLYIVMDFMPHGNVSTVVKKIGPLCEWHCKSWFPPIARAIKYLHENRVAHRDLKLSNVLLDAYYNPIVSDFGFSRFVAEDDPLSKTFCGTPSHYAPEIIQRRPYDPFKVDVWCLGLMLFIMINKEYPFDRRKGSSVMLSKQLAKDYHLTKEVDNKVSGMVKDLIRSMIEPDPTKRPNIWTVCSHYWFPIILEEAKYLAQSEEEQSHRT